MVATGGARVMLSVGDREREYTKVVNMLLFSMKTKQLTLGKERGEDRGKKTGLLTWMGLTKHVS